MKFTLDSLVIGGFLGWLAGLDMPREIGGLFPELITYLPEAIRQQVSQMNAFEALLVTIPPFDAIIGLLAPPTHLLNRTRLPMGNDEEHASSSPRAYTLGERLLGGAHEAVSSAVSLTAGYAIGYGLAEVFTTYVLR